MHIDLLAGMSPRPASVARPNPTILLLDSGLGGLTVLAEVRRARPDAGFVYAADDAAFPYGDWPEEALADRVATLMGCLVARYAPDLAVVACNTISTLVLPVLRDRFDLPFIGTVPAVKPAAALSRSGRISVLATPGTVRRDYTRGLVAAYAGGCEVDLVGSTRLATLAEAELAGDPASDDAIRAEIAPCFRDEAGRRTDVVVLACTHYPLLLDRLRRLAPWPVTWVDPAPAIARRVLQIAGGPSDTEPGGGDGRDGLAVFTGTPDLTVCLRQALAARGLLDIATGICSVDARVPTAGPRFAEARLTS